MNKIVIDLEFKNRFKPYKPNEPINLIFNRRADIVIEFKYFESLLGVKYAYYYDDYNLVEVAELSENGILILNQDYKNNGKLIIFSKPDISLQGIVINIE